MRVAAIIVGIILLAAGAWVALGQAHYTDSSTTAQLGPIRIQTSEQKAVPAPIGYAGIVIGGVLIVVGAMQRK